MSIFTRSASKPNPTAEEAPVTVTDTPTTPAPPSMYPLDAWTEDTADRFYVEPSLRPAYAAAVPDAEVEVRVAEAQDRLRVRRTMPRKAAQRLIDAGEAVEKFGAVVEDTRTQAVVSLRVTPAEWLHVRRMEQARDAAQREQVAATVPSVSCCACGVTAHPAAGTVTPAQGAAYRLGLRGPVCGPCGDAAAVVLAEEALPDGRTRRQAVAEAAGLGDGARP